MPDGTCPASGRPDDRELRAEPGDTVDSIVALYREIIVENQAILDDVNDLNVLSPSTGLNRRWVLLHLLEELGRHAGHADIIREALDGSKGV